MAKIDVVRNFAAQVAAMDGFEIGEPVVLEEISFVPILKNETPRVDREYLTLAEALDEQACHVIDKGNEVAHIVFENTSEFPILIEEGEIFHGMGTQDRMAVGTVMVAPGTVVEIPVKCVHAPHYLSSGAAFVYGGKCSREMLNELRVLKSDNARKIHKASSIDQGRVWRRVEAETAAEAGVSDETQYFQTVSGRGQRASQRVASLQFPKNAVGVAVITPDGQIKGLEVHRSSHNFQVRKEGILESVEASVSWTPTGSGPFQEAKAVVQDMFQKLANLADSGQWQEQVEIDGLVINAEGFNGEVFTSAFYSDKCPSCGAPKPRQKACPSCGYEEESSEEFAYMSLM